MKQLNFNDKRILKSLLDKTKTTTIRKAWNGVPTRLAVYDYYRHEDIDKPCKYKVGEIVEAVWTGDEDSIEVDCGTHLDYYSKNLGKVKITKIEKIEIYKEQHEMFDMFMITKGNAKIGYRKPGIPERTTLSDSEGFRDYQEMFEFLEEYSDGLKEAKPFWLITMEWIK